jgi:hypothetical protein
VIGALVKAWGGPAWDWLDWSGCSLYWLVGDVGGEIQGVINAVPGKPFGRIDHLCLSPGASHKMKAILAKHLCFAAVAYCKFHGSQATISTIDQAEDAWRAIAEKRGWVTIGSGSYLVKRCA